METLTDETQKTTSYICDGYIYYKSRGRLDKIYLACVVKSCWARAIYAGKNFRATHNHNHPRQDREISIKRLMHDLRNTVAKSSKSLKTIYNDVCSRHSDAASFVTYESVQTLMTRARKRANELKNVGPAVKKAKTVDTFPDTADQSAGGPNTTAAASDNSVDSGSDKKPDSVDSENPPSVVSNQTPTVKRLCYRKLLPKTPNSPGVAVSTQCLVVKVPEKEKTTDNPSPGIGKKEATKSIYRLIKVVQAPGKDTAASNTKASPLAAKVDSGGGINADLSNLDVPDLAVIPQVAKANDDHTRNSLSEGSKQTYLTVSNQPGSITVKKRACRKLLPKEPEKPDLTDSNQVSKADSDDGQHLKSYCSDKPGLAVSHQYHLVKVPQSNKAPSGVVGQVTAATNNDKASQFYRLVKISRAKNEADKYNSTSTVVTSGNGAGCIELDHSYAVKPDSATSNLNHMIKISGSSSPPPLVPIGAGSSNRTTPHINRLNNVSGTAVTSTGLSSTTQSHVIKLSGADNVPACANCNSTANKPQINLVMNFPGAASVKPYVAEQSSTAPNAKSPQVVNVVVNLPGAASSPLGANNQSSDASKTTTPQLNHVIKIIEPVITPIGVANHVKAASTKKIPQVSRVIKISEVADVGGTDHSIVVSEIKTPTNNTVTKVSEAAGTSAVVTPAANKNTPKTNRVIKIIEPGLTPIGVANWGKSAPSKKNPPISRVIKISEVADVGGTGNKIKTEQVVSEIKTATNSPVTKVSEAADTSAVVVPAVNKNTPKTNHVIKIIESGLTPIGVANRGKSASDKKNPPISRMIKISKVADFGGTDNSSVVSEIKTPTNNPVTKVSEAATTSAVVTPAANKNTPKAYRCVILSAADGTPSAISGSKSGSPNKKYLVLSKPAAVDISGVP